jgi:hypothetical protein
MEQTIGTTSGTPQTRQSSVVATPSIKEAHLAVPPQPYGVDISNLPPLPSEYSQASTVESLDLELTCDPDVNPTPEEVQPLLERAPNLNYGMREEPKQSLGQELVRQEHIHLPILSSSDIEAMLQEMKSFGDVDKAVPQSTALPEKMPRIDQETPEELGAPPSAQSLFQQPQQQQQVSPMFSVCHVSNPAFLFCVVGIILASIT